VKRGIHWSVVLVNVSSLNSLKHTIYFLHVEVHILKPSSSRFIRDIFGSFPSLCVNIFVLQSILLPTLKTQLIMSRAMYLLKTRFVCFVFKASAIYTNNSTKVGEANHLITLFISYLLIFKTSKSTLRLYGFPVLLRLMFLYKAY
jgi:hypothetical protein